MRRSTERLVWLQLRDFHFFYDTQTADTIIGLSLDIAWIFDDVDAPL